MRITFDTNTLDKACRPQRHPKDPLLSDYLKVHQAIADGRIQGVYSETIISLEGMQKKDRARTLGSTTIRKGDERVRTDVESGVTRIDVALVVEERDRPPLHEEVKARLRAAHGLGLRLLHAPRFGQYPINDPMDGSVFLLETDVAQTAARLDRYHEVARELDSRGIGFIQAKVVGESFAKRDGISKPWYLCLGCARDVHEQRKVERSIAEWADGDSVAAHIGYQIDYFCTGDLGKSAGSDSVLSDNNRAWLTATYGVQFITMSELARLLPDRSSSGNVRL